MTSPRLLNKLYFFLLIMLLMFTVIHCILDQKRRGKGQRNGVEGGKTNLKESVGIGERTEKGGQRKIAPNPAAICMHAIPLHNLKFVLTSPTLSITSSTRHTHTRTRKHTLTLTLAKHQFPLYSVLSYPILSHLIFPLLSSPLPIPRDLKYTLSTKINLQSHNTTFLRLNVCDLPSVSR